MSRSGRRPGDSGTKEAILEAARSVFGEAGFDGASIRTIARAAAVDPALVHHYFGTKQQLFVAATEFPFEPEELARMMRGGPPDQLGERVVRFFLSVWDDPQRRPVVLGIVRSAVTDEVAAAMARRLIFEGIVAPLVAEMDVTEPALRACFVGSQLIGLAVARYILEVPPLSQLPSESIVAAVGPVVQRYIRGALPIAGELGAPAAGVAAAG